VSKLEVIGGNKFHLYELHNLYPHSSNLSYPDEASKECGARTHTHTHTHTEGER
jgi:hypothetical protein